jgi:hypothetical protein
MSVESQIIKKNLLIAKFMGVELTNSGGYAFDYFYKDGQIKLINFASSWELLFPVFFKIGNTKFSKMEPKLIIDRLINYEVDYKISKKFCEISIRPTNSLMNALTVICNEKVADDMDDNLLTCFNVAYNFIEWYFSSDSKIIDEKNIQKERNLVLEN